jgi:hypothetical protein
VYRVDIVNEIHGASGVRAFISFLPLWFETLEQTKTVTLLSKKIRAHPLLSPVPQCLLVFKYLVAERGRIRDFDLVEFEFGCLVTIVASVGQQNIAFCKGGVVLLLYGR